MVRSVILLHQQDNKNQAVQTRIHRNNSSFVNYFCSRKSTPKCRLETKEKRLNAVLDKDNAWLDVAH